MNFRELLTRAKDNDEYAIQEITAMYKPLLTKEAIINGEFEEDLYQEFWLTLILCIWFNMTNIRFRTKDFKNLSAEKDRLMKTR